MTKKEVKQNRRKRKLFLAILMILFTGVLLTASTYAWFTANKTVTVEQIDVKVAATNGLQISVDAANWKPTITNDDILNASGTYSAAVNQIPSGDSSPVSTVGAINGTTGFMNMYAGAIESDGENYILTASPSVETNGTAGQFVAFDLFFQTTEATDIYLTSASNVVHSSGVKGIQNAARVAFVMQGNVAPGSTAAAAQELKAETTNEVIIWEPNYDVHTATGVSNALNTYGHVTTQTGAARLNYVGVKSTITAANKVALNSTDANYFSAVTPQITTTAAGIGDNFVKAFSLNAGITKIRFYMWIEGQDVDCENDASGGSISYNLQFSMNATA